MHRVAIRNVAVALAFLSVLFIVTHQCARADTEPPRVVLGPAVKDLTVGPGMNAAGRDLRGSEFVLQDLTGAIFDGCNLYDVRIYDCILSRASFRGAIFAGARIGDCRVDDADFTNAVINGNGFFRERFFYTLELSPEQLKSTRSYKTKDLHKCVISGSWSTPAFDFGGADLRQARLINGDFTKCDFTNARIHRTTFGNFTLSFEQLASSADFGGRHLHVHILRGGTNANGLTGAVDFSGIDLEGSELSGLPPDADFTDARISGCAFREGLTKAQLYSTASYKEGNLTRLVTAWSDLAGCDLAGMNLTGSRFGQCDFTGANLEDAVITDVNFVSVSGVSCGCRGLSADQIKSTWNCRHHHMKGITLPNEISAALELQRKAEKKSLKKDE